MAEKSLRFTAEQEFLHLKWGLPSPAEPNPVAGTPELVSNAEKSEKCAVDIDLCSLEDQVGFFTGEAKRIFFCV